MSRSLKARQCESWLSVAWSRSYGAVTTSQAFVHRLSVATAFPARYNEVNTARMPMAKSWRISDSPKQGGRNASPTWSNAVNRACRRACVSSSRAAFFFTGTSLLPVLRTSRAALAHSTMSMSWNSSWLEGVRNTRSPIFGSITSSVPSSSTSVRASVRVTRPVWVSLRPAPTQRTNAITCSITSGFAAARSTSLLLIHAGTTRRQSNRLVWVAAAARSFRLHARMVASGSSTARHVCGRPHPSQPELFQRRLACALDPAAGEGHQQTRQSWRIGYVGDIRRVSSCDRRAGQ